MALCSASTKSGRPCANIASGTSRYCHVHSEQEIINTISVAGLGCFLGNLIIPGWGGLLLGAVTTVVGKNLYEENNMQKKRVFVSFDFDNDRALKEFIIGQSKLDDSPFSVIDHSLKEAAPERDWKSKARAAINRSDIVLVMVGPKTHTAPGVLAEVQMAREAGIPIVQVIGYRDGNYTPVKDAGRLYGWSWENLKNILG